MGHLGCWQFFKATNNTTQYITVVVLTFFWIQASSEELRTTRSSGIWASLCWLHFSLDCMVFPSGPLSAFLLAFIARSHVPALVGSNYRGWEGLDVTPGPWACMIGYSSPECLVQRPRPDWLRKLSHRRLRSLPSPSITWKITGEILSYFFFKNTLLLS